MNSSFEKNHLKSFKKKKVKHHGNILFRVISCEAVQSAVTSSTLSHKHHNNQTVPLDT